MAALVGIIVLVAGVATASARTGASARHPLKKARPSASPTKWRALAAAVPSPSNLHVLTVTKTTANVSWTAPATGVAGYTLYRNGKRVGTTTQTGYAFGRLRCARSYTLAVDAYTASGTHSARVAVTATTAACTTADTTPPGTPGGLVSTGSTVTSVSLAWGASSDNVGTVGYDVFTNGTRSGSTTSLSYTVSGLACGTSYSFSVDAYDAAGNVSARGNIAAATSACAAPLDTLPPSTPTGLVVSGSTQTSISVGWGPSVDNVGVTGYGLYRNGTRVANVATPGATFSGLTCGTTYTLGVDAYDAAGNRSATTSLTAATAACPADTTPPSAPTGLSVTGQAGTSVSLAWNASTDNVGVAGYGLYRDGTLVGTAPSPSGTFSSLTCGTTYTFAVDAFDAAGNRSAATPLSASTSACPPPGGTGTANLWVDTDGGSCLRHASPVAYTSSEACGSFDAANDHCLAGDSVRIKGGAYSSQGLTGSNGRADYCSMAEADGETVTSSGLDFGGAAWVSVQGVAVTGGTPSAPKTIGLGGSGTTVASHVRLIDVSAYPGRLFIKGSYLTVQGGEFGGYDDCLTGSENDGIQVSYVSGSPPSSQVTIDGIYLHDVRRTCGYDPHRLHPVPRHPELGDREQPDRELSDDRDHGPPAGRRERARRLDDPEQLRRPGAGRLRGLEHRHFAGQLHQRRGPVQHLRRRRLDRLRGHDREPLPRQPGQRHRRLSVRHLLLQPLVERHRLWDERRDLLGPVRQPGRARLPPALRRYLRPLARRLGLSRRRHRRPGSPGEHRGDRRGRDPVALGRRRASDVGLRRILR